MSTEHLWATWRSSYVTDAGDREQVRRAGGDDIDREDQCVFCEILSSGFEDRDTLVIARGEFAFAILNRFPYSSGHLLVMPYRHVAELVELTAEESQELWSFVTQGDGALRGAYSPGGINMGANLGAAAGAGIPGHLHIHLVPRWVGDTNFMTSIAETRVMPEGLDVTWEKVSAAWSG